ncbi:MAG TPA: ribonucleotide reductase subunit alpha [Burkholderiaceae bacterium]|nr:ribonucleotide reductase subunit alpha [Burkholderiaceae bacterium]
MSDTDPPLTDFASLLVLAYKQEEPQRMLFVFARKELPEHASIGQRERFNNGEGGGLRPCLCVDKALEEISSFESLVAESAATGQSWDVAFVGCLAGRGGIPPNPDEADYPLRLMVNAINNGRVSDLAAFDRNGRALRFI